MNRFKKLAVAAAAISVMMLLPLGVMAQSGSRVTITLTDKSNGEPIPFATVSLTKEKAKSAAKYSLSNEKGKAVMENVATGNYTIKAELLGYQPFTKELRIEKDTDLGTVALDVDQETLEAAKVVDVGNPIVIKKDTIEYNASSFKTTENDVLEDLLKKLPGVEIGDDGSITVNGETVSKITVEGKTFFLNDPQLASKNLPAKMIKKIKVLRKKSEQAEFTGIDDGNEETVIDLGVQENMMNGLFGNLTLGGGHDIPEKDYYDTQTALQGEDVNWKNDGWRFTDNLFAGKFSTGTQLSLIANANNGNTEGFTNMSGNMMRGMRGGGGGNGGITTSWMLGANAAGNLFDDKMDLGGNYVYTGSKRDVNSDSYRLEYKDDGSTLEYNNSSVNTTKSYGHRFGVRLEHKFSDNTSIFFEPSINFGTGNYLETTNFSNLRHATKDAAGVSTSDGFTAATGDNKNLSTSGRFLLRQKLGIPGRTMTFNANYSLSSNKIDGYNQSLTTYYLETGQKDSLINQRTAQKQNSASVNGQLTYTEPLGSNFYVEANYSLGWSRSTSDKDTWNSLDIPTVFTPDSHPYNSANEEKDLTYSNRIENSYINQNIGANMLYQSSKLRAQIGFGLMPMTTKNETTRHGATVDTTIHTLNIAPRAMVFYNPSDNTNLRLFYNGNSSQPSVSQLMPVPDNSNPMNISFGNPYLKPYFSHNIRGEYRTTNMNNFMSMNINFGAGLSTNPIVNATWTDLVGVRYSYPVNGPTSGNANVRMFINSPIAKSNFSVNASVNARYSESSSYTGKTSFDTSNYYKDGEFNYTLFHDDIPDLGKSDSFIANKIQSMNAGGNARMTYRDNYVELTLGGGTTARKSWYTVASASTDMTWNNNLQATANWTTNNGWTFQSDFRYNWYNGYSVDQDDEYILGAQISKILGSFTLALRGYDLLNQSKSISITDNENYHTESRTNVLGRYVIFSVSYRFGSFGRGGRGGRGGGGFRGGPGGFGGGGFRM